MFNSQNCKRQLLLGQLFFVSIVLLLLIQAKFSLGLSKSFRISLHKSTNDNLGKSGQSMSSYYANIQVGTPPKNFKFLIDVNAREVWLPHYHKLGALLPRLNYNNGYCKKDSSSSVKEGKEFKIDYQGTELEGKIYRDVFEFKDVVEKWAPYPVAYTQRFLVIGSASNVDFRRYPDADGVFGLSSSFISETGSDMPLLAIQHANLTDELRFSLNLDRDLNSKNGGELTIGAEAQGQYSGALRYHQSLKQFKWEIAMQSVMFGAESIACHPSNPCKATISTVHNDLYGPEVAVARIIKGLGLIKEERDFKSKEVYEIDCLKVADGPAISFAIDGNYYKLNAVNYIRPKTEGIVFKKSICYVAILANTNSGAQDSWTLGTNFLANYNTIFDASGRRVAFASRS